jgi:hypothetical protein
LLPADNRINRIPYINPNRMANVRRWFEIASFLHLTLASRVCSGVGPDQKGQNAQLMMALMKADYKLPV